MITKLHVIKAAAMAGEKGTFGFSVSFYDEETPPVAVTPNNIKWSLYDEDGAIVNSRQDIVITPTASVITIVLSGNDLELSDIQKFNRRVLIEYDYNSNLGNNLPSKIEYEFIIENLDNVI